MTREQLHALTDYDLRTLEKDIQREKATRRHARRIALAQATNAPDFKSAIEIYAQAEQLLRDRK